MEWSLGVEPWHGVLEWREVRFGVIAALLEQDLVLIDQFLVNAYFYDALCTCSLCFFYHVPLTCFNQALNICFIFQTHNLQNASD